VDFEDLVIFQITEGGAKALALMQSMLVDAQIQGAVAGDPLGRFAERKLLVNAPNSRLAELLAAAQGTGTDALVVLLIDVIAEGLGAVPVRPHSGQFRQKALITARAL
jgi:hypothetical protein